MINGGMSVLDMSTVYGIYGEDMGIHVFKYFFLQSIIATCLAQTVIGVFGTRYVGVMIFMTMCSAAGYVIVDFSDLSPPKSNLTISELSDHSR